jgi:hypothetical protein
MWVADFALVLPTARRATDTALPVNRTYLPRSMLLFSQQHRRVWCSRTNRLAEGRNGRGLVVLDIEEAVQLGDLEQVADPPAEVHQL